MIVTKHGFKKKYAYGGSGIFDTIANFLTRMFTSSAAKQIASSALDVGKSVAKEGGKESSRCWEKCRCRCRKEVSYESVNTKIEENFTKIYGTHNTARDARHEYFNRWECHRYSRPG